MNKKGFGVVDVIIVLLFLLITTLVLKEELTMLVAYLLTYVRKVVMIYGRY